MVHQAATTTPDAITPALDQREFKEVRARLATIYSAERSTYQASEAPNP